MAARSDEMIVSAMKADPEKGFRLLMAEYKEAVYWHIRRLVVSHTDAQDAAQETFGRIFRSFGRRKADSSLRAWIYRIATNEALRTLERNKADTVALDNGEADRSIEADEYVDYTDLMAVKLQKAIQSLPQKQQLAFNLRYYDELSYGEIADITGSTPESVKASYHIAKEKIIKYMNSND